MKICVVGIGKLGYAISKALLDGGNDVTILDSDEIRIQNAGNNLDAYTVLGDALKTDTLKEIGIAAQDLLIAATEDDERNMIICSFAKKMGCPKTMARVSAPQHINQLDFIKESLSIDQLLNPDYACAKAIDKYLTEEYSLKDGLFTQDGIAIAEFAVEKKPLLIGKKIMDSTEYLQGMLIGAISRNGKIIIPKGSNVLEAGDILYVAGKEDDVYQFRSGIATKNKQEIPQRVMIAGGGKTGYFLAKLLEDKGIAVKILEINPARCKTLAASLNDTVVLNADAAEIDILREEGLESMDAFVAATGYDEENLLLSLLVQQYGIKDVVAKVSRTTFIPIIKEFGTNAIINPQEIVANNVMSFVRRSGIVLFSKMINGQAEFREIQAESSMPLTKKCLADMDVPEGVIILSIHRGNHIIIPNGKTQIASGDRVLVLSLLSSAGELEGLLTKTNTSIL